MNYIGSKHKLSDFIQNTIRATVGDLADKTFAELFAGTGIISRNLKPEVKGIIINDIEPYSFVLNRNYIGNNTTFEYSELMDELNALRGTEGFIYQHYCVGGGGERQYFSNENGLRIDAMRQQIENWKAQKCITEDQYFFLLASLLESADKVANTASVYGAYLKNIKKSAAKKLVLEPAKFDVAEGLTEGYHVYNDDANALIKQIKGDVLYLDPPYNARQYGANYHMLNTIALYDQFEPQGKTGLRAYKKSAYCRKGTVAAIFEELINLADFQYIFVSYNNEGLMSEVEVQDILSRYGEYSLVTQPYQRFKADKTENRNHTADATLEYLHILVKEKYAVRHTPAGLD